MNDLLDYHIRLNLPYTSFNPTPDYPQPLQSRYKFLFNWLENNSNDRFAISIEERNNDNEHIHCFATITKSSASELREIFRKNILPNSTHKRPYSIAQRRGNLLAYLMKDISHCICDQLEEYNGGDFYTIPVPIYPDHTGIPPEFVADFPDFFARGFGRQELLNAWNKSYPKIKLKKETFENLRSNFLINWKESTYYVSLNAPLTQNSFIEDLVEFHISHNRAPPRQNFVNFWLLKLGIITTQQYRFRKYTNFF